MTPLDATPCPINTSIDGAERYESPERLSRPLIQLAKINGVATSYIDQLGTYVEISDDVLINVLEALGVEANTPTAIEQSLAQTTATDSSDAIGAKPSARILPSSTLTATVGEPATVRLNHIDSAAPLQITIMLEDGTTHCREEIHRGNSHDLSAYSFSLPDNLPIGYHTLHVANGDHDDQATLMVAPACIPLPQAVAERPRWGWMAQLYSIRSHDSWGVGDYGDLTELLAAAAAKTDADFMLINPVHAGAPVPPLEPSPYLPESRRFFNVTYIRPQNIPEYAELSSDDRAQVDELHASVSANNDEPNPMGINAAWNAKRPALRLIFDHPRSPEREAEFARFKEQAGPDLDAFAAWCLAFEVWGAPWEPNSWFARTNRTSPEVADLIRTHHDLFEFNRWLQWIANEQLGNAQKTARANGMAIGLIQDMAVGVHALGADVWWSPERFAVGSVTVGCPPDFYNQQGQDWGQPPFSPRYLEATGYRVYREMVHSMFEHAGAVRIDHALGLFRLWWIPQGKNAKGGAYVMYNYHAMIAILSIEATRANGMVIGEDLGTVPPFVRQFLSGHGVLGTDVEWFARIDDSPNAGDPYTHPSNYRQLALASVTTHDLPPTAGYLEFEHVRLRERLHLLTEPVEQFARSAEAERQAMLDLLVTGGWLTAEAAANVPEYEQEIIEAMHRMLISTPSVLRQAAIVDGTGQHATVNQPGTSDQYPNWRVPLMDSSGCLVHTDDVFTNPRVLSLAAIMSGKQ
ncbi:4-alpha-glucanotransferase [Bifidobacterium samirii]|uniref:4-alpha-glucanotransferase n=1 Tax=Bifidobacterium samirii TaxID=2306974 RepID=A0A430FP38_9BIFI|nr:4-alpha-glucanotransferase [Bifidobacterium samirii]RSX54586.1 4-alpha-glucanotransferase [Bifidobacterium samirii]